MLKRIIYSIYLLALFLTQGCGDSSCNVLPDVRFSKQINQAEHLKLFSPGGAVALSSGGVCGLIIYNMGSQEKPQLIAYDRCSTVNPEERNVVELDGFIITDPVSKAQWLLQDGSPASIAECPLKPYYVRKVGDRVFIVEN